jgi:hypothetical protein
MAVTRITSRNIQDYTIEVKDLHDLGVVAAAGLNIDFYSGTIRDGVTIVAVSSGSLLLAASSTNYVEVSAAGVVSSNTTGFTTGRIPLAVVVTGAATITSVTDKRAWLSTDQNTVVNRVENETPSGTINGVNAVFTLAFDPNPDSSLRLSLNGLRMHSGAGNDYTLSGVTITFETNQIPQTGDTLLADYRY